MKWVRLSSEVKQQWSKLFYPPYEDDDAENKKRKKERLNNLVMINRKTLKIEIEVRYKGSGV